MLFKESKYVFFATLYTICFFANFLIGIWSNSKDAKIKDSLREILENIVSGFFKPGYRVKQIALLCIVKAARWRDEGCIW